jgi:hypothetical protein
MIIAAIMNTTVSQLKPDGISKLPLMNAIRAVTCCEMMRALPATDACHPIAVNQPIRVSLILW